MTGEFAGRVACRVVAVHRDLVTHTLRVTCAFDRDAAINFDVREDDESTKLFWVVTAAVPAAADTLFAGLHSAAVGGGGLWLNASWDVVTGARKLAFRRNGDRPEKWVFGSQGFWAEENNPAKAFAEFADAPPVIPKHPARRRSELLPPRLLPVATDDTFPVSVGVSYDPSKLVTRYDGIVEIPADALGKVESVQFVDASKVPTHPPPSGWGVNPIASTDPVPLLVNHDPKVTVSLDFDARAAAERLAKACLDAIAKTVPMYDPAGHSTVGKFAAENLVRRAHGMPEREAHLTAAESLQIQTDIAIHGSGPNAKDFRDGMKSRDEVRKYRRQGVTVKNETGETIQPLNIVPVGARKLIPDEMRESLKVKLKADRYDGKLAWNQSAGVWVTEADWRSPVSGVVFLKGTPVSHLPDVMDPWTFDDGASETGEWVKMLDKSPRPEEPGRWTWNGSAWVAAPKWGESPLAKMAKVVAVTDEIDKVQAAQRALENNVRPEINIVKETATASTGDIKLTIPDGVEVLPDNILRDKDGKPIVMTDEEFAEFSKPGVFTHNEADEFVNLAKPDGPGNVWPKWVHRNDPTPRPEHVGNGKYLTDAAGNVLVRNGEPILRPPVGRITATTDDGRVLLDVSEDTGPVTVVNSRTHPDDTAAAIVGEKEEWRTLDGAPCKITTTADGTKLLWSDIPDNPDPLPNRCPVPLALDAPLDISGIVSEDVKKLDGGPKGMDFANGVRPGRVVSVSKSGGVYPSPGGSVTIVVVDDPAAGAVPSSDPAVKKWFDETMAGRKAKPRPNPADVVPIDVKVFSVPMGANDFAAACKRLEAATGRTPDRLMFGCLPVATRAAVQRLLAAKAVEVKACKGCGRNLYDGMAVDHMEEVGRVEPVSDNRRYFRKLGCQCGESTVLSVDIRDAQQVEGDLDGLLDIELYTKNIADGARATIAAALASDGVTVAPPEDEDDDPQPFVVGG
jgi:hypothetical protein